MLSEMISIHRNERSKLIQLLEQDPELEDIRNLDIKLEELRVQIVSYISKDPEELKMQFDFIIDQIGEFSEIDETYLNELSSCFDQALKLSGNNA